MSADVFAVPSGVLELVRHAGDHLAEGSMAVDLRLQLDLPGARPAHAASARTLADRFGQGREQAHRDLRSTRDEPDERAAADDHEPGVLDARTDARTAARLLASASSPNSLSRRGR